MAPAGMAFGNQRGVTLLELLLVVTILSALAFITLSQVTDNDAQVRFEDTRNRLARIRYAIVGDRFRTINGQPEIRGFVADMGRLPLDLNELVTQYYCANAVALEQQACLDSGGTWETLPLNLLDPDTGLRAGWNGPYLSGFDRAYPDGWGNDDGTSNFGWVFSAADGDLQLQSKGMDNAAGGDPNLPYELDYPPAGSDTLVYANEHSVLVTVSGGTDPNDDNGQGLTVDLGAPFSTGSCSDSSFPAVQACLDYGSACRVAGYDTIRDSAAACNGDWMVQDDQGWSCQDPAFTDQNGCALAGHTWSWRLRPGFVCNLPSERSPAACALAGGTWTAPTFACRDNSDPDDPDTVAAGVTDKAACEGVSGRFWTPVTPAYIFGGSSGARLCLQISYRQDGLVQERTSTGSRGDHDLTWNGNPKTPVFSFEDDTPPHDEDFYLPLGELAYRVVLHDGSSCTDPDPSDVEWRRALIDPGAGLPVLPWPID